MMRDAIQSVNARSPTLPSARNAVDQCIIDVILYLGRGLRCTIYVACLSAFDNDEVAR